MQWRDRFLKKRLVLCLWISYPCLFTYTLNDLLNSDFTWSRWIEADLVRIVGAIACGIFYQTKWGKDRLQQLMLVFSLSITMLPNLWMIVRGLPAPSEIPLNMVYVIQTALIPVCWRIHLASQIGATSSHWLGCFLDDDGLDVSLSIIYWSWIALICTLAVYLYERLQQQEFESRRELNIFLHSISHDLRAPVMGSSMVLQNLLRKDSTSDTVPISRSILKRLLSGSDRTLSTINSLLEAQSTVSHELKLNRQPCNIYNLVESILVEQEPIFQQNKTAIDNRVDSDLPVICADTLQLWRDSGLLFRYSRSN